jgi:hypothetical protein
MVLIVVVAAGSGLWRLRPGAAPKPPAGSPPAAPPPVAGARAAPPAENVWDVAPRLRRDPFERGPAAADGLATGARQAGAEDAAPVLPTVRILLLDPQRPLAVVDTQRVAIGDSVAGFRVVGIDAGGVTLERHGRRTTVRP